MGLPHAAEAGGASDIDVVTARIGRRGCVRGGRVHRCVDGRVVHCGGPRFRAHQRGLGRGESGIGRSVDGGVPLLPLDRAHVDVVAGRVRVVVRGPAEREKRVADLVAHTRRSGRSHEVYRERVLVGSARGLVTVRDGNEVDVERLGCVLRLLRARIGSLSVIRRRSRRRGLGSDDVLNAKRVLQRRLGQLVDRRSPAGQEPAASRSADAPTGGLGAVVVQGSPDSDPLSLKARDRDGEHQLLIVDAVLVTDAERRQVLRTTAGRVQIVPVRVEALRVLQRGRPERRHRGRLRARDLGGRDARR